MSDEILPNGTKVRYHGSVDYMHGEYTVLGLSDLEARADLTPEQRNKHWPDGIAYDLWPVGVPYKFGYWREGFFGLHWVRRESFTVIEDS